MTEINARGGAINVDCGKIGLPDKPNFASNLVPQAASLRSVIADNTGICAYGRGCRSNCEFDHNPDQKELAVVALFAWAMGAVCSLCSTIKAESREDLIDSACALKIGDPVGGGETLHLMPYVPKMWSL